MLSVLLFTVGDRREIPQIILKQPTMMCEVGGHKLAYFGRGDQPNCNEDMICCCCLTSHDNQSATLLDFCSVYVHEQC